MTLKTSLRGYLADIQQAFDRAPVECALTFATALLLSYTIEHKDVGPDTVRIVIAAVLTFGIAWGGTLLEGMHAITRVQRWTITLLGAAAAALYLLLVSDIEPDAEPWRAFMLVSGLLLLLLALPAWIRDDADASLRLRRVNGRIALRTLTIGLYGLALFGGLALAIVSVDKLFELNLKGNLYGHVYVWIMVVLVPWVIVGGLSDYVRPVSEPTELVRVIHRFNPALLFPQLAAIYYIILCAYAVRIAITGELPQNMVSPLVIAAGALAALALIVFDPDVSSDWSMRWLRFTPVVFLPLGVLGVWALTARIDAYGWTEFRLLRMLALLTLMVLAALATVQLMRRSRFSLRVLPLAAGALLILGAIGPWGVPAIARRDQQGQLRAALARAHVDLSHAPARADSARRVIAASLYDQINSTANYLRQHFGDEALAHVLPAGVHVQAVRGLADFYHLVPGQRNAQRSGFSNARLASGTGVRLKTGDWAYSIAYPRPQETPGNRVRNDTLFLLVEGDTVVAPLGAILRAATQAGIRNPVQLDATSALVPAVSRKGRPAELIVTDLVVRTEKGKDAVQHLSGLLIVHP